MLHLKQSIDVSGVSGNDFLTWRAGVLHTWWKWLNRNVLWKRCHWELFSVSRGGEVSIKCPILWWEQQHPFHGFSRWLFLILPFSQPFRTRLDSLILTCPFQVGYPVILWFLGRDRGLLLPLPWRSCRNQSSCKENFGDERHQGSGFVCVVLGLQGSIR